MNRREFLGVTASALAYAPMHAWTPKPAGPKMGISIASYAYRWNNKEQSAAYPAFTNALQVLEHSHNLGAGGIQIGVRGWEEGFAGKVRDAREKNGSLSGGSDPAS